MEKIWIKKELYILSYEFLKFMPFSVFNLIFNEFLIGISYLKSRKGGFLFHRPRDADVARGTAARMRRGTEPTWQGRGWPTDNTNLYGR